MRITNPIIRFVLQSVTFVLGWIAGFAGILWYVDVHSRNGYEMISLVMFLVVSGVGFAIHLLWIIARQMSAKPLSLIVNIAGGYLSTTATLVVVGVANVSNLQVAQFALICSLFYLAAIAVIESANHQFGNRVVPGSDGTVV